MQGQRGAIGSFSETLDIDHGSISTSSTVDHQICWNNMGGPTVSTNAAIDPLISCNNAPSPAENQISNCVILPNSMETSHGSSFGHQWPILGGWNFGESSSSDSQSEVNHNEQKAGLGWSSLVRAGAGSNPRLQERRYEQNGPLSLDSINRSPLFIHNSSSGRVPQNLNLNASFVDEDGVVDHGLENPHIHNKSNGMVNEQSLSNTGSSALMLPSVRNGYTDEDSDSRSDRAMEARRLSCKRKAVEGIVGQPSVGGSSAQNQHTENGAGQGVPAEGRDGSSSTVSGPQEQVHARLGLIVRNAAPNSLPESSGRRRAQRNFRLRINPSNQHDSIPSAMLPSGSARHSSSSPSCLLRRFIPNDHSPDLRSADAVDSLVSQSEQAVVQVPPLPQNSRWNSGSSSRTGQSSNTSSVVSVGRDPLQRVDVSSRSITGNISEHPMFLPASDLQNLAQNPVGRMSLGGNSSLPGNVASSSWTGVSSSSHPSSSSWVSRPNPPQYPRRLTEYLCRSLFSAGSENGVQSSINSTSRAGATAASQERVPTGAGSMGHHWARLRSSPWIERQGDGDFAIPSSLRALAAASEGSGRLVSEIRNVLGLMRRGESLRLEDVMILDHSVFSGMADLHDRHRDMRLDVDNMSYEELLALEERIGNVSTGLSEETISNRLKQKKYFAVGESETEGEPCCICQEEYNDGEDIGSLDCGHDFHGNCIKQWLMHKNICPICKTAGLAM